MHLHQGGPALNVARPKRILVVDDCRDTSEALAQVLEIRGHEVSVAHSGAEALSAARSFKPNVCLLDISLPVMNGYEIGKHLRAEHEAATHHLQLVALSGHDRSPERERAEQVSFDAHLTKPVNVDALIKLIAD
ncbi:response regulator [Aquabacterium sp.]|uniref:response regulator n=1 Tax=Aquabacterium sp. TaxID=1872578 RepID=UPI003D6C77B9